VGDAAEVSGWMLRIANALGTALTLCTEPEPSARERRCGRSNALARSVSWMRCRRRWRSGSAGRAFHKKLTAPAGRGSVYGNAASPVTALEWKIHHESGNTRARFAHTHVVDGCRRVLTNAKLYNVPGPTARCGRRRLRCAGRHCAAMDELVRHRNRRHQRRVSPAVEERARQVKMTHVYQGTSKKFRSSNRSAPRAAFRPTPSRISATT